MQQRRRRNQAARSPVRRNTTPTSTRASATTKKNPEKNWALQLFPNLQKLWMHPVESEKRFHRRPTAANTATFFDSYKRLGKGLMGTTFVVPREDAMEYADVTGMEMRAQKPPSYEKYILIKAIHRTDVNKNGKRYVMTWLKYASDLVREAAILRYLAGVMPRGTVPRLYFAGMDPETHFGVIGMQYMQNYVTLETVSRASVRYADLEALFRHLWFDAGLFHMDVHEQNILKHEHPSQGKRLVLIDFSRSIRIPEELRTRLMQYASRYPKKPLWTVFDDVINRKDWFSLLGQVLKFTSAPSVVMRSVSDWAFLERAHVLYK